MKTKICLILTCLILSSCAKREFPVASVDSVYIEKLKEVPIYIPGDSIKVEVPANCPDQELITIENEKLKYELVIEKGKVKTKTIFKSDTVKVYVPEIHEKVKEVKVPQIIKETPKFWKITGWTGIAFILALVAYLGFKIKKLI